MPPKRPKSGKKGKGKKNETAAEEKSDSQAAQRNHPEDILPLVVTSASQELFGCVIDEDVTRENPHKLLKKDDIIHDMKTRAAVSDFSPAKQLVHEYPDDELLLVFDADFTYGYCFYLVLTPEAKDRILKPPEPEKEEEAEIEVSKGRKTPEPKEWISLGSEKEIDEEAVKESRKKLVFGFSRDRSRFGAPVSFSDCNSADAKHGHLECPSYQDGTFSIKQLQNDRGVQADAQILGRSIQTERKFVRNIFTQYMPVEFNDEEKENFIQSDSLRDFCKSAFVRISQNLQQEENVNVFSDDWEALAALSESSDWSVKSSEGLMVYQVFTDQKHTMDKNISCVNWHPTIYGVIAVALIEKKVEQSAESTALRSSFIRFYSFLDPCNAKLLLESPDDIFAFQFCPSDPNIIVGGCVNGQVVLWDISDDVRDLQGALPGSRKDSDKANKFNLDGQQGVECPVRRFCAVSSIESRHKAAITDIQWLPETFEVSRTGLPLENRLNSSFQIVTCSPDCSLMFWDIRGQKQPSQSALHREPKVDHKSSHSVPDTFKHLDRTWKPLFRVSLPNIDTSGEYTSLKFSLESYTCDGDNKGRSTGKANAEDDRSEVNRDYSQLSAPSDQTVTPLEDVNTKLYIGTEDGKIVYTDWKLEKDDSGQLHSTKPLHCFTIHHLSVNSVQRSPFLKDVILTVGGWNFAIWKEEIMNGPIILSPSSEQLYTAGCWSPTRPAVFFIGKEDGSIEVWNMLEKKMEPLQVQAHITNAKITCLKPWVASSKQHFLAVTDDQGMLRVLEIPKTLYSPSRHERVSVNEYVELEGKQLKELSKEEESSPQQKEAEEEERSTEPQPDKNAMLLEEGEEENMEEYSKHPMLEENILKSIGLWPADAAIQAV